MNENIKNQFWKLFKEAKLCKQFNEVRKHEEIHDLLKNVELDPNDKYYSLYFGFKNGKTVMNKFGKKLYFEKAKLGE